MEQASKKLLKAVENLSMAKSVGIFGLIVLGFTSFCLSLKCLNGGVSAAFAIGSLVAGILGPIMVCIGCDAALKYLRGEEEKQS